MFYNFVLMYVVLGCLLALHGDCRRPKQLDRLERHGLLILLVGFTILVLLLPIKLPLRYAYRLLCSERGPEIIAILVIASSVTVMSWLGVGW